MKTRSSKALFSLAAALLATALAPTAAALTTAETTSLLFLEQEEKMARDIYQDLSARWGSTVFLNIAAAEQRHLDAVSGLLTRFGVTSTAPAAPGRYSFPELQTLHDDLIRKGTASLEEALQVGVSIEEADLADLDEALAATREPMILRVLTQLHRGSAQHLVAFQRVLAADGQTPCTVSACGRQGKRSGTGSCGGTGMGMGAANRGGNRAQTCTQDCTQNCAQDCTQQGTGTCTGTPTPATATSGQAQRRGQR